MFLFCIWEKAATGDVKQAFFSTQLYIHYYHLIFELSNPCSPPWCWARAHQIPDPESTGSDDDIFIPSDPNLARKISLWLALRASVAPVTSAKHMLTGSHVFKHLAELGAFCMLSFLFCAADRVLSLLTLLLMNWELQSLWQTIRHQHHIHLKKSSKGKAMFFVSPFDRTGGQEKGFCY